MHYLISKNQTELTTKLLTNKQINMQFINNKLIIKLNPSDINIPKLLTKNYIKFKIS